ncbi:hypothetical protein ACQPTN_34915 [Bradyrhizobium sp. 13971]
MTSKRRRFKQTQSLGERLTDEAMRLRSKAKAVPPLAKKEALLRGAGKTKRWLI